MMMKWIAVLALAAGAGSVLAQDGPPGRPEDGGRPVREGRPGGRDGFDPPMGPNGERPGPGQGQPRPVNPQMAQVELMRNWLDLIDRYAKLSKDPVSAAVAAVVSADDLMRNKPDQAVEFFTKMLEQTKNETVQRAIRLQLVEIYGRQGKTDKAVEQLQKLIAAAPAEGGK